MTHQRLHSSRVPVLTWLRAGLAAVDPETLTRAALEGETGRLTVIAIGKGSAAMCRGAASIFDEIDGLCVSDHPEEVPAGVELVIGDHPVPGPRSLIAGRKALARAPQADLALISGGGSALCEMPAEGVPMGFLTKAQKVMLERGASIDEVNLVRGHLSRVKCGGLGPIPTLVLSDVSGRDPGIVSSGPTIPMSRDPGRVIEIMKRFGLEIPTEVETAVRRPAGKGAMPGRVEVIGDGRTAAGAVADAVKRHHIPAKVREGWIEGSVEDELANFIETAGAGVTVASGEPILDTGESAGRGGRNTHAALLAAQKIASSDMTFAAMATDGVDGNSGAAGGVVDGKTIEAGGDPIRALARFDSAEYLDSTDDLITLGPTGTNVADLWLIWKPRGEPPILTA